MMTAFLTGFVLGGFVAAQVGPVSLMCVRTATRHGFWPAASIGLGAALVDLAYATLGVLGAAALVQIDAVRVGLAATGAAVLAYMGCRTLAAAWRMRHGGETEGETTTSGAALRTGLVATASNPLTIISWAAIFGAATTASLVADSVTAIALLFGVGLGSALWFLLLARLASHAGKRLGQRTLAVIDAVSGLGLLAFAALLGVRAFNES